jgi:hypothetical protein
MFAALIIATVLDLSLALPPSSVSGSFCMCKISTAVALCLGYVGILGHQRPALVVGRRFARDSVRPSWLELVVRRPKAKPLRRAQGFKLVAQSGLFKRAYCMSAIEDKAYIRDALADVR